MKKLIILFAMLAFSGSLYAQKVAIKNNLAVDATLTPNLALEIALGGKTTLDLYGSYQPWDIYGSSKKMRHWYGQPEVRLWTCEKFNGTFFGLHAHGGEVNVGGWHLPFGMYKGLRDNRYEGYFYGAGISVGHQWILGKRWNLEASIGGGWARIHYDQYPCAECSPKVGHGVKNYFGPTKATLTIVFFIK